MTNRNAPCPCGSEEKYKRCCAPQEEQRSIGRRGMILAGVAALVGVGFVSAVATRRAAQPAVASPAAQQSTAAQPAAPPQSAAAPSSTTPPAPGETRPGQVWSKEHKHWHAANASPANPVQIDMSKVANPNATAGSGMVWSKEHNHWHKTGQAAASGPAAAVTAQPAAGAPAVAAPTALMPGAMRVMGHTIDMNNPRDVAAAKEGKIWSAEHGHWHDLGTGKGTVAPRPGPTRESLPPASTSAPAPQAKQ